GAGIERILSVKEEISPAGMARALPLMPKRAARALIRREMLKAAALQDPLPFIRQWEKVQSASTVERLSRDNLAIALDLLKSVLDKLRANFPADADVATLVAWYVDGASDLEYEVAEAQNQVRNAKDEAIRKSWSKIFTLIRQGARALLDRGDRRLAELIGTDMPGFLRRRDLLVNVTRDLLVRRSLLPPKVPAVWLVVFDGMRWDTWARVVRPLLEQEFNVHEERPYFALLPSITQVSRTGLVAGQPPAAWRDQDGRWTKNEAQLGARGFNLKREEVNKSYRYVTRADANTV